MRKNRWGINSHTSGIYKITNIITHEYYIGASKNIAARWRSHFNNYKKENSKEYNCLLHQNIRKYGIENFNFKILKECNISELDYFERYYIKLLKPKYNITPGGKGGHVGKPTFFENVIYDLKYTSKSFKEMAVEYKCCKDTISSINSGKKWHDENLNYPIRIFDPKKIAMIRNGVAIIQFDKKGNFIKEWESISEFERYYSDLTNTKLNVISHISQVCQGKRKSAYGYIWKYKKDYYEN